MKHHIFRRIFLLYAAVVSAAFLVSEIYISSEIRQNYVSGQRSALLTQIGLIAGEVSFKPERDAGLARRLKTLSGARVTIVRQDGQVVGDSDADYRDMDNHAARTEIAQAALSGDGMSVRRSGTLEHDFLYVAKKISARDGKEGFVRFSQPLEEIEGTVNRLRLRIVGVIALALLASGGIAILQTERLRRLLLEITDFSRSLSRGEINRRLFLSDAGEFNEIAENLTAMSEKLQDVIIRSEDERERLAVILTSMPDALLIIDPKGIVQRASDASHRFFGSDSYEGRQFMEVVRSDEFAGLIAAVRKTGTAGTAEIRIDHPSERHLEVRVSPLFYQGKELSGMVAVFHDITQMKLLEQVRKDFVANVSHELKTPITAIRGFAETLLEGALDDRSQALKFLATIRSNSERIDRLVDDLMTISKIELGVIRIEKAPLDPREICENIAVVLRCKAAEKGLVLDIVCPDDIREIRADRDRLIQIMTNLVDNAIKFTEAGKVSFGAERSEGKICLFVEDTGIGIAAKHLARLGERFYRVDPARSRTMGGTGLGLAIVKHLVKAHGWDMRIESTPGRGTRIEILLQDAGL
ncbi:MAG: phosphate regulon sensor histidine kinase PhoR [Thermodesulfovibrionales bacterium]